MGIASWAFKKNQHWLIDAIDMIKGSGHCKDQYKKVEVPKLEKDWKLRKEQMYKLEPKDV